MLNHKDILTSAVSMLRTRGDQYGPASECFERISAIASSILGKEITKHDVAIIHVATKLARMTSSRKLADNYVDAVNYMAFAAEFAKVEDPTGANIEDDIAAVAKRFAPSKVESNNEDSKSTSDLRSRLGIYGNSPELPGKGNGR